MENTGLIALTKRKKHDCRKTYMRYNPAAENYTIQVPVMNMQSVLTHLDGRPQELNLGGLFGMYRFPIKIYVDFRIDQNLRYKRRLTNQVRKYVQRNYAQNPDGRIRIINDPTFLSHFWIRATNVTKNNGIYEFYDYPTEGSLKIFYDQKRMCPQKRRGY